MLPHKVKFQKSKTISLLRRSKKLKVKTNKSQQNVLFPFSIASTCTYWFCLLTFTFLRYLDFVYNLGNNIIRRCLLSLGLIRQNKPVP